MQRRTGYHGYIIINLHVTQNTDVLTVSKCCRVYEIRGLTLRV